jgi:hypothetical protein
VNFLGKIIDYLAKELKPPRPFSWQTLILLSLFSAAMAYVATLVPSPTSFVHNFIKFCGWFFLILGAIWWQLEKPLKLFGLKVGWWAIAIPIDVLIFTHINYSFKSLPFISLPILAGFLSLIRIFFRRTFYPTFPPPELRLSATIIFLIHVLMSCWIQFYFVLSDWSSDYPTLTSENLDRSSFVFDFRWVDRRRDRGEYAIETMEGFLKSNIQGKPWENVRQFMQNLEIRPGRLDLDEPVKGRMVQLPENSLWSFKANSVQTNAGYRLQLLAIWEGPRMEKEQFYFEKLCEISQNFVQPRSPDSPLPDLGRSRGNIECEPRIDLFYESPPSRLNVEGDRAPIENPPTPETEDSPPPRSTSEPIDT